MRIILIISTILALTSCDKDMLGPQYAGDKENRGGKILILNEGSFGWGNGSISLYNRDTKEVSSFVYQNQNGSALGDVVQSANLIDDNLYVVVNNSGKVVVMDTSDFTHEGSIAGLSSPRYIIDGGNGSLYISDLYADEINVVDKSSYVISTSIALEGWTEYLYLQNGWIYAIQPDIGTVVKIDPSANTVTDSLKLSKGLGQMIIHPSGTAWVLSNGGTNEFIPKLYTLDLNLFVKQDSLEFNLSDSPSRLCANSDLSKLFYVIDKTVFSYSTLSGTVSHLRTFNGTTNYGLHNDPFTNELYYVDAKDYVQNSRIYRMDSLGQVLDTFDGGIISGSIFFMP